MAPLLPRGPGVTECTTPNAYKITPGEIAKNMGVRVPSSR